jgi:hypothetical protein
VKLQTYKHLLGINAGFDEAIRNLTALRKCGPFHDREIERFRALSREARAATNSYIASVIEKLETDEAGRLFGKRRTRELREE